MQLSSPKQSNHTDPLLLEQDRRNVSTVFNSLPTQRHELALMTLNFQYFASYPKDGKAAHERLKEVTEGCDIICVQEGLSNKNVLTPVGFELCICAGEEQVAQSVHDMVYGDAATLRTCDPTFHNQLLCNQIYRRQGSSWNVLDKGVIQISSDLQLVGGGGRAQGKLAIRSMAWVKIQRKGGNGPAAYVMCTHFSGGRFEDQYFVQQLADERFVQPTKILDFFENRPNPRDDDVGLLIGDFNATTEYTVDGPMHGYFKAGIVGSAGVQADASAADYKEDQLCELFKTYMISPFTAIAKKGWSFAYTQEQVGVTSGFGHLIDHMAMSHPIKVVSAKVIHLTNQKFGSKAPDTDLPLTDHNSVKAIFDVSSARTNDTDTFEQLFGTPQSEAYVFDQERMVFDQKRRFLDRKAASLGMLLLGAAMLGYFSFNQGSIPRM